MCFFDGAGFVVVVVVRARLTVVERGVVCTVVVAGVRARVVSLCSRSVVVAAASPAADMARAASRASRCIVCAYTVFATVLPGTHRWRASKCW